MSRRRPSYVRYALPPESEASLQAKVMQLAKLCGWLRVHFRPAKTAKGWRTAFTGDKGFPDCVFVRSGRIIFAELKRNSEEPTLDQWAWLNALMVVRKFPEVNGMEVYVWRPADWDKIVEILR